MRHITSMLSIGLSIKEVYIHCAAYQKSFAERFSARMAIKGKPLAIEQPKIFVLCIGFYAFTKAV